MKLGPHILPGGGAGIRLVQAGATVCKLVDDFGLAAQIRRDHPGCLVIGRITESAELDPVNAYLAGRSPEQAAEDFVNRQMEKYRLNPDIEVWEGPNESGLSHGAAADPEVQRRMIWYASFETWRLVLLKSLELRGVVGNFATGTPDLALWPHFVPALQSAVDVAHDGYLGLHEYMGAKPRFGVGDNPLRYRTVPAVGAASGVQVVITEFGFDRVQGPPGYVSGAWRDLADQWLAHGDTTDPERYCADAYIWYGEELRKDPYVIGCCIFTSGTGGSAAWAPHDIVGSRIPDYLVEYGQNLPPVEEDEMAALTDALTKLKSETPMAVVKTTTGLTRRTINGVSLGTLPAGSIRLVYYKQDFDWQYGDNRAVIGLDGENIWDSGTSLEYL